MEQEGAVTWRAASRRQAAHQLLSEVTYFYLITMIKFPVSSGFNPTYCQTGSCFSLWPWILHHCPVSQFSSVSSPYKWKCDSRCLVLQPCCQQCVTVVSVITKWWWGSNNVMGICHCLKPGTTTTRVPFSVLPLEGVMLRNFQLLHMVTLRNGSYCYG